MDSRDYRKFVKEIIDAKRRGELTAKESRELLDQVYRESGIPTAPPRGGYPQPWELGWRDG